MPKRYSIWDKKSPVATPSGEVFTAEQWKERYPIAAMDGIAIVSSQPPINGGFFGVLAQMVSMYAEMGADFSEATTDEEKLEVIEAWEDQMNAPSDENTPEERIAAALELSNAIAMPTVNEDDPDAE